jgi:hypothetical protein
MIAPIWTEQVAEQVTEQIAGHVRLPFVFIRVHSWLPL